MRNLILALVFAMAGTPANAQLTATVPRERPIPPSTTPLADPSGVYIGSAMLTVAGFPAVPQIWRIDLQTQPCPECGPGQYFFSGTNFSGADFGGGFVERGTVRGSVNPTGEAFDLTFLAINCPFLNPSGEVGTAPYSGTARGGSFGVSADERLLIRNESMMGRISGRDCYGRTMTAEVSLHRQSASVPPACDSIAGNYSASFSSSSGATGGGTVSIQQAGCFFAAFLPGMGGVLEGVVTGPTSATIHVNDMCSTAIYAGTMTISGSAISGNYSGASTGAAGCCPAGPVSGTITLTHR